MTMIRRYLSHWPVLLPEEWLDEPPWWVAANLGERLRGLLGPLGPDWVVEGNLMRHRSARVAPSAVLQDPVILGPGATVAAHASLRGGVYLDEGAHVGPSCELKSTLVLRGSAMAHLNYVGNSIVGSEVNLEAGAVLANHFNERMDKIIPVVSEEGIRLTGVTKFGALVGDGCRIGANAVTTPGTLLLPGSIVGRLQLVDQVAGIPGRA